MIESGSPFFVLGMARCSRVKALSRVFTARCSEPQAAAGNGRGEEAERQIQRAYEAKRRAVECIKESFPASEAYQFHKWGKIAKVINSQRIYLHGFGINP